MENIINFISNIDNSTYNKIRHSKSDAECRRYLKEQLTLSGVVSSKPKPKSLRQIIEERRTNLCLTSEILKKDGKNETFFVGKYELLDNILNEFDGIEEAN